MFVIICCYCCFQFLCMYKRNILSSCRKNHRTCKWKINRGVDSLPSFNTRMSIAWLSSILAYWCASGACVLTHCWWQLCTKVTDTLGAVLESFSFFLESGIHRVHWLCSGIISCTFLLVALLYTVVLQIIMLVSVFDHKYCRRFV